MSLTHPLRESEAALAAAAEGAAVIAPIERLPKWLLCIPIGAQLLWLGARYGSVTLPSVLNPGIENGGLVGESKYSYLNRVGEDFRGLVADTAIVAIGADVEAARQRAGISYPLIAKPDIGWCGYGVRRVADAGELRAYAAASPAGAAILLQELIAEPNEAGLHYIRAPGESQGRVVAMTIRHPPAVTGDGASSIDQLIDADIRARPRAEAYRQLLPPSMRARVPDRGERVVLTTVASTRMGGRYEDATDRLTPALNAAVDALCRSMGDFEYGRLDVRFRTLDELHQGRFKIIEINGAGSEAIQYWDPRVSMRRTFEGVFAKQRELFALAARARKLGRRPVGVRAILKAHFKQQRLIRAYPPSN